MSSRFIILLVLLGTLMSCSTTEVLKQPCSDPGLFFYVDDCGPLEPINEAFDAVLVEP